MDETQACPICTMTEVLVLDEGRLECVTCGHEWEAEGGGADEVGEVRDANGALLQDGDAVALIKDLKLKGSSSTIKIGTRVTNIRLVAGDHEIDCKVGGRGVLLKAMYVKKA